METSEVQSRIESKVDLGVVERLSSFLSEIKKANEVLTLSVSELSSMLFVELNELAILYKNLGLKLPSGVLSTANVEQWIEKFLAAIHRGDVLTSANPSLEDEDLSDEDDGLTSGTETDADVRERDNDDEEPTGPTVKHESPIKPPPSSPKSESPPPLVTQKLLKPPPPSSSPLVIQKPEGGRPVKKEGACPKPDEADDAAFRFFAHHVGQTLKREHQSRLGQPVSQIWLEGKLHEKWNSLPEAEKVTWERASKLSR